MNSEDHDPLAILLEDNSVTEIIINDFQTICFEKNGTLFRCRDEYASAWSFQRFIQAIMEEAQVKLDLESPFVSFAWRSFRVHICHPPLSKNSHLVTMRRIHRSESYTLDELLELNSCNENQVQVLRDGLHHKKNILVVGGTGTGKTTTLSALLKELKDNIRIVVLEDTDEIAPPNRMSAKLLTRESSHALCGYGLGDLLKESLRMRPDRLVVGEVRGGEAKDLLLSLSTGHQGSMATLHASSPQEALLRLEMLIQIGAPHWSVDSIRKLISLTINWIVVVERHEDKRRIEGIYEITSLESVGFLTQKIA